MSFPLDVYDFKTDNLLITLDASVRLEKGDLVNIQGIDWNVESVCFAMDNCLSVRSERVLRMIVFCKELKDA